jgi:UDP-glucose 4-epimerase
MKVVVCGATGNVGTSVVEQLSLDSGLAEIVAVARRTPQRALGRARFVSADIAADDLATVFAGADVVVHLAWLIQPGRDETVTGRVNVDGSRRVFAAAAAAGVPALVYASSVGAYSPGPKDRRVDESWSTQGIPTSFYSRHKVLVERQLDALEHEHSRMRIVRLRPGLIFKRSAATEIRRLFAGPLLPTSLLRSGLAPFAPDVPGLRFQAVHSDDVADAYRRACVTEVAGAFNIAADPVIDVTEIARLLQVRRRLRIPRAAVRAAAAATYGLRLQPAEPGWIDLALDVPVMSVERAHRELGWEATHSASEALAELIAGMREGADDDRTAPLSRATSGRGRAREFLTGLGARQ